MIRFIEELSMNAWPAVQTLHYDGWVLRFANGYTRRANSINPVYPSSFDLAEKISQCEQIYTSRAQNTVFKMTGANQPPELDGFLAQQGYTQEAPTSVQTLRLEQVALPSSSPVTMDSQPTQSWLDAFCDLNRVDQRHVPTMVQMLNRIVPVHCFCALKRQDKIAAVGLAVAERGYVGLYDIVTAPNERNQGLGTRLLLHLLHWGEANQAHSAYLQVMLNNAPALHLYARLGFQEIYRYWYRVKALPD